MIYKIIAPILGLLFIINIFLYCNVEEEYEYKIYALKTLYSYVYEADKEYTINYYIDSHLDYTDFNYYILHGDKRISITLVNSEIIGQEEILNIKYLNISILFYLSEPLDDYLETYLIILSDNGEYRLNIGYFYTYYQKNINYFSYNYLEGIFEDDKLTGLSFGTTNKIDNLYIQEDIDISIEKNYESYKINLIYDKFIIYKIHVLIYIEDKIYVLDCPRFKTNNIYLADNLKYLEEASYA